MRCRIIPFCLLLSQLLWSAGQPVHPPLALADSLLAVGCAREAVTEYQRYRFSHPDDIPVLSRLIQAYAQSGELERAEALLVRFPAVTDSFSWLAHRSLALSYQQQNHFVRAEIQLQSLLGITHDSAQRRELHRYLAELALVERDLSRAAAHYAQSGDSLRSEQVRALARRQLKSPHLAELMSSVIPGTGELYAGNIRLGITAILVQGTVTAGIVYSLKQKYYLDAALLFSLLWTRFYIGSRTNARRLTEEYNDRLRTQAVNTLRRSLSP